MSYKPVTEKIKRRKQTEGEAPDHIQFRISSHGYIHKHSDLFSVIPEENMGMLLRVF